MSASSERILAWELPLGDCIQDIEALDNAINSITVNSSGVIAAGGKAIILHRSRMCSESYRQRPEHL